MDTIRIIRLYMTFSEKSVLINKQWLNEVFTTNIRLNKWKSKRKLYSYMRVFGTRAVNMSWKRFCKRMCHRHRRSRNNRYALTWKSAARVCMEQNVCQSCGRKSLSNVFGICLCSRCRGSSRKKYAYMVNVTTAVSLGIPRHILNAIPVHRCSMSKYRFWHTIEHFLTNNNAL
jgi:hypothetical protein